MQRITLLLALATACRARQPPDPGPDLQIVGETLRLRPSDPVPRTSPWFDGHTVTVAAARGETIGLQVLHRGGGPVTLALPNVTVHSFAVDRVHVARASTQLYGDDSRGTGDYPDDLRATEVPATDPAYFTITAAREGHYTGELDVAGKKVPVVVDVAPVTLELPLYAWAEYHPDELGGTAEAPSDAERACIAMFREHGVLLAPPIKAAAFAARKELMAGAPYVPVDLGRDVGKAGDEARAWKELALAGQKPFAIPIDEPAANQRASVRAFAEAVHAANRELVYAVTDVPRAEYGDAVDLYIPLTPKLADTYPHWTYNGASPRAGSMVVDAPPPGTRTWGWIGWRYKIPIWYAWEALYWHDRYNRRAAPPRPLDAATDATSFDEGEDHGNLDGVLALPGCHPTLRLEALRRGLEDRALLELAAKCDPKATAELAAELVPRALGDASGKPAWPSDEAPWEAARQQLLGLARCKQ